MTEKLTLSRVARLVSSLLLAAAVTQVIDTTSASAASCSSGALCYYKDKNYGGISEQWVGLVSNRCYSVGSSLKNQISSAHNYSGHRIDFFIGGCDNSPDRPLANGVSDSNMGGWWYNDDIESSWVE